MSASAEVAGRDAISWASISTQSLLAELRKRQDTSDERPACGTGRRGHYDTAAHVFALFLILALSTLACGFPLISRRSTTGRRQKSIIFYCQHVGTGVLLATAFVHLLPVSFKSLTDPCLPYFFSHGYTPLPGLVAMVSAIVVVAVESYLTERGAGHAQAHAHDHWDGDDEGNAHIHSGQGRDDAAAPLVENHRATHVAEDDSEATPALGSVDPLSAESSSDPKGKRRLADGSFHDADSDLELEMAELYPAPENENRNGQYASLKPNNHASGGGPQVASPEEQKRQMLQCLLLEAGILFHSVFIGMAISVSTGGAFVVFLIAISFHQSFEGLALGSRIAAIQFPKTSTKPWLMVLAYGLTTPFGQAIGLVMHGMYDPQSMGGLLVVGFMNAISAGLLLYAGLVQLLAEDFLSANSYRVLKGKTRLQAFLAVVAGAILMAIVGAFA